jgi:hypothetical protein
MMTMQKVKEAKEKMEREVAATVVTRPDLTLAEIGRMFGVSDEWVKYIMTKLGVPRRSPGRLKGKKETT